MAADACWRIRFLTRAAEFSATSASASALPATISSLGRFLGGAHGPQGGSDAPQVAPDIHLITLAVARRCPAELPTQRQPTLVFLHDQQLLAHPLRQVVDEPQDPVVAVLIPLDQDVPVDREAALLLWAVRGHVG